MRTVSMLNYLDYQKAEAMDLLQKELGWTYYGGKRCESIYTRFWQGYVLPRKSCIDKRWHYSDLINAGQMTRDAALAAVKEEPYPADLAAQDRRCVIKKLALQETEFDARMALPLRSFRDYSNNFETVQRLRRFANRLRARGWYAR